MSNDKLTAKALKQHDNIHPNFKASRSQSSSHTMKETGKLEVGRQDVGASPTRTRKISTTEKGGKKSPNPPKMSIFRIVAATKAWRRMAKNRRTERENAAKIVRMENTYKMEPDEETKFSSSKVRNIIKETLETRLYGVSYSQDKCRKLTLDMSAIIKNKVKVLDFKRYKTVVNVIIVQNQEQGIQIASRCVWNPDTDNSASYTYKSRALVAIVNVFGVYVD